MRVKRLGIEWGAAYDVAHPILITSASGGQALIYEAEGGDLVVEVPTSVRMFVMHGGPKGRDHTKPEDDRPQCLYIEVEDGI